MNRIIAIVVLLFCGLLQSFGQNVYYVSTTGNDSNPGTISQPWATWQKGFDEAEAGDTVYFRGGTYRPASKTGTAVATINPTTGHGNSGTYSSPICFFNYPGEVPILDGQDAASADYGNIGIVIQDATYIKLRGLTVINNQMRNTTDNCGGISVAGPSEGGNFYFENVTVAYNGGAGLWCRGYDTVYVINCDSHHNCDSLDLTSPGGDGDGFALSSRGAAADTFKLTVITGSRSWANSDDGFDIGSTKQIQMSNTWSWGNGGTESCYGDGVGIKLSYSDLAISSKRRIYNCITAFNLSGEMDQGGGIAEVNLYDEVDKGPVAEVFNNLLYGDYWGYASSLSWSWEAYPTKFYKVVASNNIIYDPYDALGGFDAVNYSQGDPSYVTLNTNSFYMPGIYGTLETNPSFTVTDADFISLDTAQLRYPRKSDGSLPDIDFGKLAPTSDLIDAGTDVGLDYYNDAPDLGWYEYTPGPQIIADHTVIDNFDDIPQQWIDSVKNMLVYVPGMSHGAGYFNGLLLLEQIDSKYAVDVWYHTSPPTTKSGNLQIGREGWGSINSTYISPTGFRQVIDGFNSGSNDIDYVIFGWSYEATWGSPPSSGINPTYNVHWYGVSEGGPDGNLPWGLTSDDYQYTGNRICMDTIIGGFNYFNDYFITKNYKTRLLFSTLPVDDDPDYGTEGTEAGFQREIKSQYLRDYVNAHDNIVLFDYADILRYNNNGEHYQIAWNQSGTNRNYSQIHPDNLVNLPNTNNDPTMEDHIGGVGAVRLGKALWWLFARMAGWDGVSGGTQPEPETDILTFSLSQQTEQAVINTTNHTVNIRVVYGTDLTNLTPTITVSPGASINPASGVSRNFTNPVTYTVSSGSVSQTWTVIVTIAPGPSSLIKPIFLVNRPVYYEGKIVVIK